MKTLAESLFDADLVSKVYFIGNKWEIGNIMIAGRGWELLDNFLSPDIINSYKDEWDVKKNKLIVNYLKTAISRDRKVYKPMIVLINILMSAPSVIVNDNLLAKDYLLKFCKSSAEKDLDVQVKIGPSEYTRNSKEEIMFDISKKNDIIAGDIKICFKK